MNMTLPLSYFYLEGENRKCSYSGDCHDLKMMKVPHLSKREYEINYSY